MTTARHRATLVCLVLASILLPALAAADKLVMKNGDVISIGDRFGWVQELRARYVVVRDRDGVETLIPNENLVTSEVTNWSYSDRRVRVKIPVQISYDNDPEFALAWVGVANAAAQGMYYSDLNLKESER